MPLQINVELLLGTKVRGRNNRHVGRIEEIGAELRQGECYITEYHIGSYAAFERLAALSIGKAVLSMFGPWSKESYAIPWDKLDLTDPAHPKLMCPVSVLRRLEK
jgi:hypothetical protein